MSRFLARSALFEVSTRGVGGKQWQRLVTILKRNEQSYKNDREITQNLDRLITVVHYSNAANIGRWSEDCRQSSTNENHEGRVERLDYNSRMVLHCARQTNSHKTRRFLSNSNGFGDTFDNERAAIRGIKCYRVYVFFWAECLANPPNWPPQQIPAAMPLIAGLKSNPRQVSRAIALTQP